MGWVFFFSLFWCLELLYWMVSSQYCHELVWISILFCTQGYKFLQARGLSVFLLHPQAVNCFCTCLPQGGSLFKCMSPRAAEDCCSVFSGARLIVGFLEFSGPISVLGRPLWRQDFFSIPATPVCNSQIFPCICGRSIIKYHCPSKSDFLEIISPFARFPHWEVWCGT